MQSRCLLLTSRSTRVVKVFMFARPAGALQHATATRFHASGIIATVTDAFANRAHHLRGRATTIAFLEAQEQKDRCSPWAVIHYPRRKGGQHVGTRRLYFASVWQHQMAAASAQTITGIYVLEASAIRASHDALIHIRPAASASSSPKGRASFSNSDRKQLQPRDRQDQLPG